MTVLLNDFRAQWSAVGAEVLAAVDRVGASGWYILGREVERFESALASAWGLPHAVGVGNGLDAIEIGLRCLGIRPGDKVLTTPLSAFATTLAVMRCGGVPVFVDTDASGLLDLDRCRNVLSRNPGIRFVVPVHLYGHCVDLESLEALREEFDLRIVEDCAQAIGARFRGRGVGTVGQVAAAGADSGFQSIRLRPRDGRGTPPVARARRGQGTSATRTRILRRRARAGPRRFGFRSGIARRPRSVERSIQRAAAGKHR